MWFKSYNSDDFNRCAKFEKKNKLLKLYLLIKKITKNVLFTKLYFEIHSYLYFMHLVTKTL